MKSMKAGIVVIALVSLTVLGCAPQPASIEPTPTKLILTTTALPSGLSVRVIDGQGQEILNPQITYASSAADIAAIDAAGSVTAKASGHAVITITSGEITAEVPVEVALYSDLQLEPTELSMTAGELTPVKATVLNEKKEPAAATVLWQTSDPSIATVSPTGDVTAVAAGQTTITATAASLKRSLTVAVAPKGPASLRADKESVELKVGKTEKVEVQALDETGAAASGVTLTWTTTDENIATVSAEGEIKAVAKGTTTITATAGAQAATIDVKVK